MTSILEQLFWGELNPSEEPIPYSTEYEKNTQAAAAREEKLKATLNETQQGLLVELLDAWAALSGEEEQIRFEQGFKLGVRFTREVWG